MSTLHRGQMAGMLLGAALALAVAAPAHAEEAQPQQHILITMSSFTDDLHRAMMAIKLARALQDKGAQVSLFLNLEAVPLADTRRPNELVWGPVHTPFSVHFTKFVEEGGKVVVCPHCAAAVGLTAEHLRPGVSLLEEDLLADIFLQAGKVMAY